MALRESHGSSWGATAQASQRRKRFCWVLTEEWEFPGRGNHTGGSELSSEGMQSCGKGVGSGRDLREEVWEGDWRGLGDHICVTSTHQRPGVWVCPCFDWSGCGLWCEGVEGCGEEQGGVC